MLFLDDCHGMGTVGKTGKGVIEYFGMEGKVDIITSTFGKAMTGQGGGFVTGKREVIQWLRSLSRTYVFSNNISVPQCAAIMRAMEVIDEEPELVQRLQDNSNYFKTELRKKGFTVIGNEDCPIVPIMVYDEKLCFELEYAIKAVGVHAGAATYPIVPKG